MCIQAKVRLAKLICEILSRDAAADYHGRRGRRKGNGIEVFDPEGEETYINFEWLDPESGSRRECRLTISIED